MKRRTNDQSDKQMTKGTTFNLDQIDRHPILIIESLEGGWTDQDEFTPEDIQHFTVTEIETNKLSMHAQ